MTWVLQVFICPISRWVFCIWVQVRLASSLLLPTLSCFSACWSFLIVCQALFIVLCCGWIFLCYYKHPWALFLGIVKILWTGGFFQFFVCSFAGWDQSSGQSRAGVPAPWPLGVCAGRLWACLEQLSPLQAPLPTPFPSPASHLLGSLFPCLVFSREIAVPYFCPGPGGWMYSFYSMLVRKEAGIDIFQNFSFFAWKLRFYNWPKILTVVYLKN